MYISDETKKIGKNESNINNYINENNYRQSLQYLFLHLTSLADPAVHVGGGGVRECKIKC